MSTALAEADGRARELLESFLDEKQLSQLERWNGFAQTGSDGRCYVVLLGDRETVYDPADGRGRGYYCAYRRGEGATIRTYLPDGDVALAMKLAVETDAPDLQRKACTMSYRPGSPEACECDECGGGQEPWSTVDPIWADHCGGAENAVADRFVALDYFREHGTRAEVRELEEAERAAARERQILEEWQRERAGRQAETARRVARLQAEAVRRAATTPDGYTRQQLAEEDWSHPYRGPDFGRRWYARPPAPAPAPGLRIVGDPWRVEFNGRLQATLDPALVTDARTETDYARDVYSLAEGQQTVTPERTITLTFRLTVR